MNEEVTVTSDLDSTKLLISLIFDIVCPIVKEIKKDGFQAIDLIAFLGGEDFRNEIGPCISGLKDLSVEFKAMDLEAGFELAGFTLAQARKIIAAIKPV